MTVGRRRPRVAILHGEGCPNWEATRALVERIAAELRLEPELDVVRVADADAATELRFLGSPTVRVDGRDVEPGAGERREFVLACRVYPGERGFAGHPPEGWIRDALAGSGTSDGERLPRGVEAALAAARIPQAKHGPARTERPTGGERELYVWILRRFATRGRPGRAELREAAERIGVDAGRALETLACQDLVHLGRDGEIAVAYPFSGRATAHLVRFRSRHAVYAMCAIDALGIAPMLDEPVEIASHDPLTDEAIGVRLAPGGGAEWEPAAAVVVAGAIHGGSESFRDCCPALNFFASAESAERWLEEHPEAHGRVVSMDEAIAAGRAVFGAVLDEG